MFGGMIKATKGRLWCFGLLSKIQLGSHVVCVVVPNSWEQQEQQHRALSIEQNMQHYQYQSQKVISACPLGVVVCGQKLHCPYWLFKIITILWLTKQQKLFVKNKKEELDKVSVGSGIL